MCRFSGFRPPYRDCADHNTLRMQQNERNVNRVGGVLLQLRFRNRRMAQIACSMRCAECEAGVKLQGFLLLMGKNNITSKNIKKYPLRT